jgi:hypothetical protein
MTLAHECARWLLNYWRGVWNRALRCVSSIRSGLQQNMWTTRSKHLVGDAIDICPFAVWSATGPDKLSWDVSDPNWQRIGAIGEAIGLKWGGRWTVKDLGHFEYVEHTNGPKAA